MGNQIDIVNQLQGTDLEPLTDSLDYNVPNLLRVGGQLILFAIAIAAFFFLLIGSFQWITAGGDKEGIEKARKKIVGALIGLTITISIFALIRVLDVVFGIDLLQPILVPGVIS